jgi:hypothetical protein
VGKNGLYLGIKVFFAPNHLRHKRALKFLLFVF